MRIIGSDEIREHLRTARCAPALSTENILVRNWNAGQRLPSADHASRAIVAQMKEDEGAHAALALKAGGVELPAPVRAVMKAASKVMTTTAYYV